MTMTIETFAAEWMKEAELTERVLIALTDESLQQQIDAERRTLGDLAWHLVTSIHFMRGLGLDFDHIDDRSELTNSAIGIAEEYRRLNQAFLQAVRQQWTDESLHVFHAIAGEEWRNDESLRYSLMHQAHHRGQMTVLMRQAGLKTPPLYGPTYETWIEQGKVPLK
nr:DinB family protein [Paenibacillus sinopodophylli]